ncbi:MAG: hypothetical protein AMXMBFR61_09680 [Fimbriimonadales bacterium]
MEPQFPLLVEYYLDEEPSSYASAAELGAAMEFHDSDTEVDYRIWDACGRPVRVKVVATVVRMLELYVTPPERFNDEYWREAAARWDRGHGCMSASVLCTLALFATVAAIALACAGW